MQNLLYRPVVLSYFSQSGDAEKDYLTWLEQEYKSIAKAWEQVEIHSSSEQYLNVYFPPRGGAGGDDVAEDIRHYKKRIVLFHFSGHARSQQLLFKDKDANAAGLAGLLGEAPNLKLVVLNGCATYDQVKLLFGNNVKIVIATKGEVDDRIAGGFAVTFFSALSTTDYTIRQAFEHALNKLKQDYSQLKSLSTRPLIWRGLDTVSDDDRNHWELYIKDEKYEKELDDPKWWKIGELPTLYSKPVPAVLLSTNGVSDPNVFVGRKEELETIFERLNRVGQLLLINAEGGIGKTTLSARYWNESLYEYKYRAWLFCENGIVNALKELAPQLNLDLTGLDEAQQLTALCHALKQVHDDFLLVLDNANDEKDIRSFRQVFEGFHWHVLITSRCQGVLEKEQELYITHLPPPQAKELFEKYYREESPDFDALLDRLLNAINYHTLLVELFAKNLHEASELGTTLTGFLQKLETGGLYLGEDSFEIQTSYTGYVRKAAATTDDILDILYDFTSLNEAQRYLLVNLALLPAENYKLLFLIDLLAPKDQKAFRDTVKSLYHKGWLSATEQTYRLSPVVQELLLKKNANTLPADAVALLENLMKKMENDGANFTQLSLLKVAPLAKMSGSLSLHLSHNPTYPLSLLNYNAGLYFEKTGDLVKAIQAYEKFGEVSIGIGNATNLSVAFEKLGSIYERNGDLKNALENYQKCKELAVENFQRNPKNRNFTNNLAIVYSRLGSLNEAAGLWKEALECFQEYNRLALQNHQNNLEDLSCKSNLVNSYERIGGIYESAGLWENALKNYEECKRLALEIYQISPDNLLYKNGLTIAYQNLGDVNFAKGDFNNALLDYLEYERLALETYQSSPENLIHKNGLAIVHEKFGLTYQAMGDWKGALNKYEIFNRLEKELCQSSPSDLEFKKNLAISYLHLGDIYYVTEKFDKALEYYQEYNRLELENQRSSPYNTYCKNGVAISFAKLGAVFEKQNLVAEFLNHYQQSQTLFKELLGVTQGKNILFAYHYALNSHIVSSKIKQLVQDEYYKGDTVFQVTEQIKKLRREGFEVLKPLAGAGALTEKQKELLKLFADESWYEF